MSDAPSYDDLLQLRVPEQLTVTPDGEWFAAVVGTVCSDPAAPGRTGVHVAATADGLLEPLPGAGHDTRPSWSPDGSRLAFASDRASEMPQVHVWDASTGEVAAAPEVPGEVESILWSGDGRSLLTLVAEAGVDRAGAAGATQVVGTREDPWVVRPGGAMRRLFLLDLDHGIRRLVSPAATNVWEVAWTGTGDAVAVVSDGASENDWYTPSLCRIDVTTGECTTIYRSEEQLQSPTIGPAGRIVFLEGYMSDRGQGAGEIRVLEEAGDGSAPDTRTLDLDVDVQRLLFVDDGRLFYVGQRGIGTCCGFVDLDGYVTELWSGAATIGRLHLHHAAVTPDGRRVLATVQAVGRPPEVALLEAERRHEGPRQPAWHDRQQWDLDPDPLAGWTALTSLNDGLAEFEAPRATGVGWIVEDTRIEGFVLWPRRSVPGPAPLVVWAHGGPNNAWTPTFNPGYNQLGLTLADAGYVQLFANQRGSTGRGQPFTRAHQGDYGPMDLRDLLGGVEVLAAQGLVDRDRVGIIGASAGGFLAAWAATAGHESFAAAIPMACVSNWVSFHNTSNIPHLTEIEFGSSAYDPLGNHTRLSPIMHARRSTTATLVVHGELDRCTPLGQAQELYQALTSEGGTAELVIYPREGHAIRERAHLADLNERVHAWFGRYL